jgi:hypothetical protein
MLARAIRTAVFASVMLAVWSFARPAHAQALAPFSDDRGATGIALPPPLQGPEDAVERAAIPPSFSFDFDEPGFGLGLAFDHGHHPGPSAAPDHDRAVGVSSIAVPPAGATASLVFDLRETNPPFVEPARVERPPRV